MMPMNTDPQLQAWYDDEAAKSGYTEGFVMKPDGPTFIYVTDDPERAWAEIGEYLLYEAQTYASFQTPGQVSTPRIDAETIDDLKRSDADRRRHARRRGRRGRADPGDRGDDVQPARGGAPARPVVAEPRALRVRRAAADPPRGVVSAA